MGYKNIPSRHKNKLNAPASIKNYANCRMIIDCTDIRIQIPQKMNLQKATFSYYRSYNSFKVLLGIAPNGVITFVSNLYPGSISDKKIIEKSGILDCFHAGDLILADKGFLINDLVPNGVTVNIPPLLHKPQFTASEFNTRRQIAKCRVHVERAIGRMKVFKLLCCIPASFRPHADKIVKLVAALCNFQSPLIREGSQEEFASSHVYDDAD